MTPPAAALGEKRTWTPVARSEDLRGEGPHAVNAGGVDLVVLRTRAGLRAFEGRCPHQGALLGEGEIHEGALVCRNHRWRFDAESGRRLGGGEACLRACPLAEESGLVRADLAALGPAPAPARGEAAAATVAPATRRIDDLPSPPGLPVLGHALALRGERLHLTLEAWAAALGPVYALRAGSQRFVVVSDPRLIEQVLRARPETWRRFSPLEPIFRELGGKGVFTSEGGEWRPQRKLAMEALSHRHLRGFYPTLSKVASRLLRRLEAEVARGAPVDILEDLRRFTVDVTTPLAFGHDVNSLERSDDVIQRRLELIFPTISRRMNALVPYWRYVRLPSDRRADRAVAELQAWLSELIAKRRAILAAEPARASHPENFLEAMLAARDAAGRPFADEVVFGNAMQMLVAGEDTTANTLAWTVHHLCDEPRVVLALRAEADALLGDAAVPPDLETADRLAYATAVANESMRLRPVAPFHIHDANHDTVVGDVAVPRGTSLVVLMRPGVLDEKRFAAPREFRPERWLDGRAPGDPHDPAAHMPFGTGPRICPGRSLALVEMRVVLATLYRAFDVTRVGDARDVTERFAFTMGPVGLRVRLAPRRRA